MAVQYVPARNVLATQDFHMHMRDVKRVADGEGEYVGDLVEVLLMWRL